MNNTVISQYNSYREAGKTLGLTKAHWQEIRHFTLFKSLSDDEFSVLMDECAPVCFAENQFILEQEQLNDNLYVIVDGAVEILQTVEEQTLYHTMQLSKGDSFGELGFVRNQANLASYQAAKDTIVLKLNKGSLQKIIQKQPALGDKITSKITFKLIDKLTESALELKFVKTKYVESLSRHRFSHLLTRIIVWLTVYLFAVDILNNVLTSLNSTTVVTVLLLISLVTAALNVMRIEKIPLATIGLTKANWRFAVLDSLWLTALVILYITAVKWFVLTYTDAFPHWQVFDLKGMLSEESYKTNLALMSMIYCLAIPLQELFARGFIQSYFQTFFTHENRKWHANLIASCLFAIMHLHVSVLLAIAVIPLSLFWGWLYTRQKTLIGCCLSHILIGFWCYNVLGLSLIFAG